MPGLVDYPSVVHDALYAFGPLFKNEPERRHFAEYLTGLLVAERKTVSGINREFADTTDQSCLNRWLTEADWDVAALNEHRLKWLQQNPSTRYSEHGSIAIDNVLVAHDGKLIEDVGWYWDHADKRNLLAHDYLIANYVCNSGLHYPLEFRRFRKADACAQALAELDMRPDGGTSASAEEKRLASFQDHHVLFRELVDWVLEHQIPGDFTFDCYFTSVENLNYIQAKGRGYVGDLKFNRKLTFKGKEWKASEFAAQLPLDARKAIQIGDKTQWYFTVTVEMPNVDHKVRIVILWDSKNGKEPVKMLVTNRTYWGVTRVLGVYRKRWTGTETFHRDGKQQLGLGDCQLRSGLGQTRHMYMVFVAYSLLVTQLKRGCVSEWAKERLTTIGQACRAALRETLGKTIDWVIEHVTNFHWPTRQIKEYLALA